MKAPVSPFATAVLAGAVCLGGGIYLLCLPQLRELGTLIGSGAAVAPADTSPDQGLSRAEAKEVQTKAELLLPKTDDQYDLSVQIEALTKSVGATLDSISLDGNGVSALSQTSSAANVAAKRVAVTVAASGSYSQLQRLVTGLGGLERLVQVGQVQFSGSKDGAMTAQITAFAYYLE